MNSNENIIIIILIIFVLPDMSAACFSIYQKISVISPGLIQVYLPKGFFWWAFVF